MNEATQKLLSRLESKRRERSPRTDVSEGAQLWSYREAASVLHCFMPDRLRPLDPALTHSHPRALLFDDIVSVAGKRAEGMFMLKPELRRAALRRLNTVEAMRGALKSNPDRPATRVQVMWEEYLSSGSIPDTSVMGYAELVNFSQIASWMEGIDPNFPSVAALTDLLRRKSVLATFEHLVTANFTGRVREIAMLCDHVGVLPPSTRWETVLRQLSNWLRLSTEPILMIHGPGGIGKSALIGRMLWEHSQTAPEARIPFAYLAFDQPTLRIAAPFTLLLEAAAQFELQLPEQERAFSAFRDHVRKYRDERHAIHSRKKTATSRHGRISEVQGLDHSLYESFAQLLDALGTRHTNQGALKIPILIVLDTFEEVQYRDRESLADFWRMLNVLQGRYPPLRVVISGRASVSGLNTPASNVKEVLLAELQLEDSVHLLQRMGVSDPAVARAVAQQIGGNPLSLRLAANLVLSQPESLTSQGIQDLNTRKWLFFQLDEALIQGQLYRRILDHIHDEKVRKLAHPGMVLRRVNPDIILEVLGPVCDVEIENEAEAERLFQELRRENALVRTGDDGTLEYRPEVRSAMICLLERDRVEDVRKLRRAAIAYYSLKTGLPARGEELYHRLALAEDDLSLLDERWKEGVESFVAAGLEEYSDPMKAWLASRMNLEVPREVFLNADVAEWERNTTRKVQTALSHLDIDGALELLSEREERSKASPLFALEAKAYMLKGDLAQTWTVLQRGVQIVTESRNRGRLAELFWLQSQVALLRHDLLAADTLLKNAQRAIEGGANPLAVMHVLCHRLLLRRQFPAPYADSSTELRVQLNEACARLEDAIAFSAPYVIELATDVLGDEFPKTTRRFISLLGHDNTGSSRLVSGDSLTSENLQGLDEYREKWELRHDSPSETMA